MDQAVAVAKQTFESGMWSEMPIWDRSKILHRFGDLIDSRLEDLFRLETLNNGRPIAETRAQVTRLSGWYRYNASLLLADRIAVIRSGKILRVGTPHELMTDPRDEYVAALTESPKKKADQLEAIARG